MERSENVCEWLGRQCYRGGMTAICGGEDQGGRVRARVVPL